MNFDTEQHLFKMSDLELVALKKKFNPKTNPLGVLPEVAASPGDIKAVEKAFNRLGAEEKTIISKNIQTLSAPIQIMRIHYSVGDELVSQQIIGWSAEDLDNLAVFGRENSAKTVSERSAEEYKTIFRRVLVVDPTLKSFNLNIKVSRNTLIVFLAVLDFFRFAKYQSLLTHTAPLRAFTVHNIITGITNSTKQDFRWPLNFMEKMLPFSIIELASAGSVVLALEELCNAGLIDKNEGEKNEKAPVIYSLSDVGELIATGVLHDASKIALQITSANDQGEIGAETMLFLRDAFYLWLFDVSGNHGWISSITTNQCEKLLAEIFSPKANEPKAAVKIKAESKVKTEAKTKAKSAFCSSCGTSLHPDAKFCGGCGQAI